MNSVRCPLCATDVRLGGQQGPVPCDSCGNTVFAPVNGPNVLVAHESREICIEIGNVVQQSGCMPLHASHGGDALQILQKHQPAAAVVDVALGGLLSFQLVDFIRKSPPLANTKVVLVASVFNKTAYKRRPTSLYGADDYVEQHHLPDYLPKKLRSLLNLDGSETSNTEDGHREAVTRIADASASRDAGNDETSKAARAIVADIALYHQDEVEQAVQSGTLESLRCAVAEGRRMLAEKVDPRQYEGSDPISETLEGFLDNIRKSRS